MSLISEQAEQLQAFKIPDDNQDYRYANEHVGREENELMICLMLRAKPKLISRDREALAAASFGCNQNARWL